MPQLLGGTITNLFYACVYELMVGEEHRKGIYCFSVGRNSFLSVKNKLLIKSLVACFVSVITQLKLLMSFITNNIVVQWTERNIWPMVAEYVTHQVS